MKDKNYKKAKKKAKKNPHNVKAGADLISARKRRRQNVMRGLFKK